MRTSRVLVLAAAFLAAGGMVALAQDAMNRETELGDCRSLMADRNLGEAETRLEAFVKRHKSGDAVEEAALLLARARLQAGRPQDCLDTLRPLVEAAPKGL